MLTLYYVDPLPNNDYPLGLAGVQDLLMLSTNIQANSKILGLECHCIYWY